MLDLRRLVLVTGGMTGAACILYAISIGLPLWTDGYLSPLSVSVTAGLWRSCVKSTLEPKFEVCDTTPLTCDNMPEAYLSQCLKLIMTRTFVILACILSAFSTLHLLIIGITKKETRLSVNIGIGLVIAAFVCGTIGMSVGISWATLGGNAMGLAFIPNIFAVVFSLCSIIIVILIFKYRSSTKHELIT
ncbi:hypothetical protein I4U23_027742 [Adineta vaga]|nr:hypothetical protein I4U23_027742 [Adineta vaga]